MLAAVKNFEANYINSIDTSHIADFNVGDTVSVGVRIDEKRIQEFAGVVIAINGGKHRVTWNIVVWKITDDIGVQKTFLLYNTKSIAHVKVLRKGAVRRAKLYYLKDKRGKAARIAEKSRA